MYICVYIFCPCSWVWNILEPSSLPVFQIYRKGTVRFMCLSPGTRMIRHFSIRGYSFKPEGTLFWLEELACKVAGWPSKTNSSE